MSGETVTLHRRVVGAKDDHGNATETFTDVPVGNVVVSPRQGEEPRTNRDMVILGLTVYMPASVELAAADEMTVRGDRYGVIGEPGVWRNPYTGVTRGVQAALQRIEG